MTGEREFEIGGGTARALWSRAAYAAGPLERPEPLLLAGWLDGCLSEAEAARVEAWIARTPDAAAELAALRDAVAAEEGAAGPAPAAVVARAQAIVRAAPQPAAEPGGWLATLLGAPVLRWSAVAALALVVGFGGFEMGNEGLATSLAVLQTPHTAAADFGAQPTPFL